jgi:16S rRNA (guanine527-N7)-methyltransferase
MTPPLEGGRPITGPEDFSAAFGWSDEALERLKTYESALRQWQKAVNLVAPRTLDEIWHRHFADSAQVAALVPETTRSIADLGSGGGFPGLVLAIFLAGQPERHVAVTLVESDGRKAAFLRETARRLEIPVEILSTRIESNATVSRLVGVDTVTARAFAPLSRLFNLAAPLFAAETVGVFLKGESVVREIDEARARWSFNVDLHQSVTDPSGKIAVVRRLRPKTEA